jgi:capsular polysaccharide transport system permease protein
MNDTIDHEPSYEPPALRRSTAVARALSDAARRARFSSRARSAFAGTRRASRAMRLLRRALFVVIVAIPSLASAIYYGLVASGQYVAEAKFTVSGGSIPKMDGLGSVTGLPPLAVLQDTMIVVSFIESRTLVEKLQETQGLRAAYSADSIDYLSRFDPQKPIEKFVDYWNKHATAAITMPAGIVTLKVRAFSARDAQRVAAAVVGECETLVNDLNTRMYNDTVTASEQNLQRAADALKATRVAYQEARNAEGIVDIKQTSESMNALLTKLQGQLLTAQSDYATRSAYLGATAPQMRLLKSTIASLEEQIHTIKSKMTTAGGDAPAEGETLSQSVGRFASLDLEQKIAEKRYATATTSLNAARLLSERKMLYLHQIVAPAEPEEARYPRRLLSVVMIFLASLLAWAVSVGTVTLARNYLA